MTISAGRLSREGIAKKYWAGVKYEFTKIISAMVRVEDNINFNYDNSYQGYAAIQHKLLNIVRGDHDKQ